MRLASPGGEQNIFLVVSQRGGGAAYSVVKEEPIPGSWKPKTTRKRYIPMNYEMIDSEALSEELLSLVAGSAEEIALQAAASLCTYTNC
jgi:hypothetical protein